MKRIFILFLLSALLACAPTPVGEAVLYAVQTDTVEASDAVEPTTAASEPTAVSATAEPVSDIPLFSEDDVPNAHPIGQAIGAPQHWTYERRVSGSPGGTVAVDADVVLPDADVLFVATAQPKTWTLDDVRQFISATMPEKTLYVGQSWEKSRSLWDGETVETFDYHVTNPDWPVAGMQLRLSTEDDDSFYWYQRTDFDYGYGAYWHYCRGDCLSTADNYPFRYRAIAPEDLQRESKTMLGMTPQDAVDQAMALMRPFGDFVLEDVVLSLQNQETDTGNPHPYYAVRLVRQINGLPIRERLCGIGSFSYLDNGVRIATGWPHDSILVNVDLQGICAVDMRCLLEPPVTVGEAMLVPFETVANRMLQEYAVRCATGHVITVTRIELCYVTVQDPDRPEAALVHPVWLFELNWETPSMGVSTVLSAEQNTLAIDAVTGELLPD